MGLWREIYAGKPLVLLSELPRVNATRDRDSTLPSILHSLPGLFSSPGFYPNLKATSSCPGPSALPSPKSCEQWSHAGYPGGHLCIFYFLTFRFFRCELSHSIYQLSEEVIHVLKSDYYKQDNKHKCQTVTHYLAGLAVNQEFSFIVIISSYRWNLIIHAFNLSIFNYKILAEGEKWEREKESKHTLYNLDHHACHSNHWALVPWDGYGSAVPPAGLSP